MKYAMLAYTDGSLDDLTGAEKRALHFGHAKLHRRNRDVTVIAHYRFRPEKHARTVRLEAGSVIRDGLTSDRTPRALYIVESNDTEAVARLAAGMPALKAGATIEIWPLNEPAV